MDKGMNPPPYRLTNGQEMVQPPPAAPPSYSQAVGGVGPSSPYTPQYPPAYGSQIEATVEAVGPESTNMICPGCEAEVETAAENSSGPQIVTTVVPVGPQPTHMICPSCHAEIDTATKTKPGLIAMVSGAIIFIMGCICGCCLIPCCIDSCMDVHHRCPNCSAYLGRYRR